MSLVSAFSSAASDRNILTVLRKHVEKGDEHANVRLHLQHAVLLSRDL